jgi:proton-translocating NADH-quinone oxidoreductase chain L
MTVPQYLILAALLPLAGFLLLVFLGKKIGRFSGPLSTLLICSSLALSVVATVQWVAKPEYNAPHYVETLAYRWIPLPAPPARAITADAPLAPATVVTSASNPDTQPASPAPAITVGVLVDSLTIAMFTLITLIASLVHLFSIAYMARDPKLPRYFAYLGLFCFSMLALVLSNSLIQLFVFWELVGISSFLLIGFWNENRGPATASVKAVLVNRLGDALFLVGIGLLALHVGIPNLTLYDASGTPTLASAVAAASQSELLNAVPQSILEDFSRLAVASDSSAFLFHNFGPSFIGLSWLTWAGLCLFAGAAAKSAQFPFHVWLPEAMEGPTPVSALIHAATMVAAGVFLVARLFPILTMDTRLVIAVIGCVTLAIGALIALVQTDLKKILAYSTISQLGYMMLFLGAGGYTAGLLHLFTHAFFKAGLFLAAGSVLHNLHHNGNLRWMGGLWKKLPITAACALLFSLALAATPWLSGSLSKELGMAGVYEYAHRLSLGGGGQAKYAMTLFWVPTVCSYLTAFYIGRLWWLTFGGKSRDEDLAEHAHEHALMTLPLILLAFLSFSIWFGTYFHVDKLIGKSLPPGVPILPNSEDAKNLIFPYLGYAFAAALLAPLLYLRGFAFADRLKKIPLLNLLYAWLHEKMFFDDLYDGVLLTLTLAASRILGFLDRYVIDALVGAAALLTRGLSRLSALIDTRVIDGLVNAAASAAATTGRAALAPQSGRIRTYLLVMLSALALAATTLTLLLLRH